MHSPEIDQLEMLSAVDDLRRRTQAWMEEPSDWEPVARCRALLQRVLARVDTLRVRMEAPLVVATFGGTGTGKSALVNALVGEEVTISGRQRPTTRKPVLIAHSQTPLRDSGLPLEDLDIVLRDADLLRDVILLDCPDPDTTEGDNSTGNLERLRTLLPFCDVLLYVSTQQKYRSSRVSQELLSAAAGCRMIFVQTHADLDEDIRDDWKRSLAGSYEVPEVFFVDSRRALLEQQSGARPSGEMGRLISLLLNKLGASDRVRVRRANVLDLLCGGFSRCQQLLGERHREREQLQNALTHQRRILAERMSRGLREELRGSRRLWERRLLGAVADRWGLSPFSLVLRAYNSLGNLLASTVLFRARSAAQLALLGAVQGARWVEGKRQELMAASTLDRAGRLGLDDQQLRETELVLAGHVEAAEFQPLSKRRQSLDDLRARAADVEQRFLLDAGQRVDEIITEQAAANSRQWPRLVYETVLCGYLVFVLYRVAKNFFVDSFWFSQPLLPGEFYVPALIFLLLLCTGLLMLFTRRTRRGLGRRIDELASQLVDAQLGEGLFPQLEAALRDADQRVRDLEFLEQRANLLGSDLAHAAPLGGRRDPVPSAAASGV